MRKKIDERKAAIAAEEAKIAGPARTFLNLVGERYRLCQFDNFEVRSPAMREVLDECKAIAANVAAELDAGRSVVLAGPVGTGKDHLLAAMLRAVVEAGRTCQRIDGAILAAQCRDIIGGHTSEGEFLQRWASVDLLALSDPDGIRVKATEFYADWLFRIVDSRYRQRRSTWLTINASTGGEIAARIGDRTWDRLQHNATIIRTNWETHRLAGRVINGGPPPT